ncbi:MAG: hypothetical protein WCD07_02765 [Burkholderiales bacterium]
MTGILLIGVVVAWLMTAIVMGAKIADKLNPPWLRTPAALLLMAILIPLPVADEIIGGWQFKALCDKYAVQYIDEKNAQDRKVMLLGRGKDWYEKNTILKIHIQPYIFQDTETGKVVVSYHSLEAEGGWLIRSLGISETKSPLLFNRGCAPLNEDEFKKKFNITVIN